MESRQMACVMTTSSSGINAQPAFCHPTRLGIQFVGCKPDGSLHTPPCLKASSPKYHALEYSDARSNFQKRGCKVVNQRHCVTTTPCFAPPSIDSIDSGKRWQVARLHLRTQIESGFGIGHFCRVSMGSIRHMLLANRMPSASDP